MLAPPAQPWKPSGSLSPDYSKSFTGLGNMPPPTSSVAAATALRPPAISGDASLIPDANGVSRTGGTSTFLTGPGAGGTVTSPTPTTKVATDATGRQVGSAITGLPAPTARTGRIFDETGDISGKVMDSVAKNKGTLGLQPPAQLAQTTPIAPTPTPAGATDPTTPKLKIPKLATPYRAS